MSERRWYRSLYWRVALGLFAFLALMVTAQSALFLWTSDRIAGSMPARSPRRLAALVASDIGTAVLITPTIDLEAYVRDQFGSVFQPFVVVMRDGRLASNHGEITGALRPAIEAERERLARTPEQLGTGADGRRGPRVFGGVPPERAWEGAPVIVDGRFVGAVAVLTGPPPFSRVVSELGPTLATVAAGMLATGMTLIALFVFGPARRRLKQVQQATERLGGGDLTARAPEEGGDEVTAVARSFNRMADELTSRAQALETSDRLRRQLLADVSHELMTPLTAMRGYVETLTMQRLDLDAATRERYLRIIDDETHRLERIVGDLLDLARLEGGGPVLRSEAVSVEFLFERVRSRHERESISRDIRLVTQIDRGAEVVAGDPDRLEQALQNLAANALRHTPDGGTVTLSSSLQEGSVHIRVRDTGEGIPAAHLPLIFERFYKTDTSRRAAGGSGLGLSIVKAIVERHGGSIAAHNDEGAVFEMRLPQPVR